MKKVEPGVVSNQGWIGRLVNVPRFMKYSSLDLGAFDR